MNWNELKEAIEAEVQRLGVSADDVRIVDFEGDDVAEVRSDNFLIGDRQYPRVVLLS